MPQHNYTRMTPQQFFNLMGLIHNGCMGEETVYACSAMPGDHLHVRRLGDIKGGDEARIGVMAHSDSGVSTLFFSAADARSLAESLLSLAEEVDGLSVTYDVPDDASTLDPGENTDPNN